MSLVSDYKKRKCASIGCTAAAALETGLDPDRLEHAEETYLPRTRATEEALASFDNVAKRWQC